MGMEMPFAERLRQLRTEKGLTQEKLAATLDYGYTAITNYESGRNEPSLRDLARLCRVLDASADYMIGLSDIRRPCAVMERAELERLKKSAEAVAKQCGTLMERSFREEGNKTE